MRPAQDLSWRDRSPAMPQAEAVPRHPGDAKPDLDEVKALLACSASPSVRARLPARRASCSEIEQNRTGRSGHVARIRNNPPLFRTGTSVIFRLAPLPNCWPLVFRSATSILLMALPSDCFTASRIIPSAYASEQAARLPTSQPCRSILLEVNLTEDGSQIFLDVVFEI